MPGNLISLLCGLLAVVCAAAGVFLVGGYFWTVLSLYLNQVPDKSPVYWYLIFLLAGAILITVAFKIWDFRKR